MDFFEFLFGKKEDKNVSSQSSSSVNNCKSESTIKSVLQSEAPSMDPIEPVSYTHLDVYKRQS